MQNKETEFFGQPISLARRLSEILEEKGKSHSIRAFSQRIGWTKDKLNRIIQGGRYCSPSELGIIAAGLKVSAERINQEDTRHLIEELQKLLKTKSDLKRAKQIAEYYLHISLGITEKCDATVFRN